MTYLNKEEIEKNKKLKESKNMVVYLKDHENNHKNNYNELIR